MPMEASSRCSSASSMCERSVGVFAAVARAVEFLAQPQLQFAGGFVGERDGDDVVDGGEPARQHSDDARDQFGGFAGSGRGFDEQAFAERGADALARRAVVELRFELRASWRMPDFDQRIQAIRLFSFDSRFFVRAAHRRCNRTSRRRRFAERPEESLPRWNGRWLRERGAADRARFVVQRNVDGGKIAALRAIRRGGRIQRIAPTMFRRRARTAEAAEWRRRRRIADGPCGALAGFVIGDAQRVASWRGARSDRWSRAGECHRG